MDSTLGGRKMSTVSTTKNISYWIHVIISLSFMFVFGRIVPAVDPLTPVGMNVLGIFIGLIWAWSFVSMAWPSVIGFIALGFSGATQVNAAFAAGMGDYTNVLLVLFCMAYGAYLNDTGLSKTIAYWFLTRKICIGRPWVLTLMVLVAGFALGFFVSAFAAVILMWGILYSMAEVLGIDENDKYLGAMIVGVVIAVDLGIMPLPYKPVPIVCINGLSETLGITMNVAKFAVLKGSMAVIVLLLFFLAMKYVFRIDVSKLKNAGDIFDQYRGHKMSGEEKIAAVSLVVFFFMLFFPSFVENNIVSRVLNTIGTTGCVALMLAVLCAVPYKGKKLCNYATAIKNGVNWDVILLLAVTIPLGSALTNPDSGIMAFLRQFLTPIVSNLSPFMFALVILTFGLIMTQFAHNIALANVLIVIMLPFCEVTGANPETMTVLLSWVLALAMGSPAAAPLAALLFGNKNGLKTKDCYIYTWAFIVIVFVCTICIGYPLGNLLFR